MIQTKLRFTVSSHFEGKGPVVCQIYDRLMSRLKQFGPIAEEAKKSSIHLVNKTALAGVATRKTCLILTIISTPPSPALASTRCNRYPRTGFIMNSSFYPAEMWTGN